MPRFQSTQFAYHLASERIGFRAVRHLEIMDIGPSRSTESVERNSIGLSRRFFNVYNPYYEFSLVNGHSITWQLTAF